MPLTLNTNTAALTVGASTGTEVYAEPSYTRAGGAGGNSFTTIDCPSGTDPVADSSSDTLTLVAGTGVTITGDSAADSVTFALSGASVPAPTTALDHLESSDGVTWSRVQALRLNGTNAISFNGTSEKIYSSTSGQTDIDASAQIALRIGGTVEATVTADTMTGVADFTYTSGNITTISGGIGIVLAQNVVLGTGLAATDYTLTINGENNDCTIKWWEDEAELEITAGVGLKLTPSSGSGLTIAATQTGVLQAASGVVSATTQGTFFASAQSILAGQIFGW